ncbi:MAG: hypothetical protein DDT26_01892 [Dehalococcoidia bacterium]|nr:hypothetical protein [Chloroflexota bacterium]
MEVIKEQVCSVPVFEALYGDADFRIVAAGARDGVCPVHLHAFVDFYQHKLAGVIRHLGWIDQFKGVFPNTVFQFPDRLDAGSMVTCLAKPVEGGALLQFFSFLNVCHVQDAGRAVVYTGVAADATLVFEPVILGESQVGR